MLDINSRLYYLYNCFINDSGTPEEIEEFWQLLSEVDAEHPIHNAVFELYNKDLTPADNGKDWSPVEKRLRAHVINKEGSGKVVSFGRKLGWVAAAVVLFVVAGMYLWQESSTVEDNNGRLSKSDVSLDLSPGMDGAILTLDDGSQVVLDSLGNGIVTTQNGTKVILDSGLLVYHTGVAEITKPVFNTISTPKGRQFRLLLPDGTKVWLNAASSLHYPTAFTDSVRKVQVTGEVYFEVAQNAQQPFIVQINNQAGIEVLGTSFNVNAYPDEFSIATTLVNGSIKIYGESEESAVVLRPGEQAQVFRNGRDHAPHLKLLSQDRVSQIVAWKNGLFDFEDRTLEEVMRQLSRWYNIDVIYEKGIPNMLFWGKMDRGLTLANVLNMLEGAQVHFRIEEGRRLIVLP